MESPDAIEMRLSSSAGDAPTTVDVLIKLLCKTDERVPDSRLVRVQFVHLCRLRPFIKLYNEQLNASEVTNKKKIESDVKELSVLPCTI